MAIFDDSASCSCERSNFDRVIEFMQTFGQEVKTSPEFPDKKVVDLRIALIEEELGELREAIADCDLVEVADALTDILYVIYGAGASFGIDLDACFQEVHASNMSKLTKEGNVLYREDGKIQKSDQYFPPNLKKVLDI